MHFRPTAAVIIATGLATTTVAAQTSVPTPAAPGAAVPAAAPRGVMTAEDQKAVEKLQQAADHLLDAIQAMQNKPEGERLGAIAQAQNALTETHDAMRALPPELRNAPGATVSTAQYDESVRKMMKAAAALRASIQALARQPAGEEVDKAIREANQALLETQSAMVLAYTPGASGSGTTRSGAAAGADIVTAPPMGAAGSPAGAPKAESR